MNGQQEILLRVMDTIEEANAQLMNLSDKIQDNVDFLKASVMELQAAACEEYHPREWNADGLEKLLHAVTEVCEDEDCCCGNAPVEAPEKTEEAPKKEKPEPKGIRIIVANRDDVDAISAIEDILGEILTKGE